MSWVKMTMKFPGKCTVCGKTVDTGQVGFWARGMGVKHEECSQVAELECMACGAPAGCPLCEFADIAVHLLAALYVNLQIFAVHHLYRKNVSVPNAQTHRIRFYRI